MRARILFTVVSATAALMTTAALAAEDITYRTHIRPLWEQKCMSCHGQSSPYLAEFKDKEDEFKNRNVGPRMDSYPGLVFYIGWPDTGAIMRRLDDGKSSTEGKPGNMYVFLGADDAERQKNLALFKSWVGEGAWFLGRIKDLDADTLRKMKVAE